MWSEDSQSTEIGRCVCGARVFDDSFRDRESWCEFYLTGRSLCQACQDAIHLGANTDEPGGYLPIVDGALVAVRASGKSVNEICLLPFRLVGPPAARIAWEARFISRAGPRLEPLDPWDELEPMRERLTGHQVRVDEHASFRSLELNERVANLALLVGLDRPSLDTALSLCPLPREVSLVSLADEVPSFKPELEGQSDQDSALRACALMGLVLLEHGCDGHRPFDHLIESRTGLFTHPAPKRD